MAAAAGQRWGTAAPLLVLALGLLAAAQVCGDQNQGAVFLREFTLIRRESLHDDFLSDLLNNHKTEDPNTSQGICGSVSMGKNTDNLALEISFEWLQEVKTCRH
ncbi:uncharacterized protein VSU04_016328 [Chlamydotis macqueenii]